jgi:hypothetical protein
MDDLVIAEAPAPPRPTERTPDLFDELAAIRAALLADMEEYEQPSAVRAGFDYPLPLDDTDTPDAGDPYWLRFVRMGEPE